MTDIASQRSTDDVVQSNVRFPVWSRGHLYQILCKYFVQNEGLVLQSSATLDLLGKVVGSPMKAHSCWLTV